MKIGIIGVGFVGHAVKNAYDKAGIETVCIDPDKGYNSTYEDIYACDAVFICVPSPVDIDGSCDTSFLKDVIEKLKLYTGVIISKVTAPPDVYTALQKSYPNLVHSPEFLKAVSADQDYLDNTFVIIGGGDTTQGKYVEHIILLGQTKVTKIVYMDIGEASMCKYIMNCFLATKVVFMNEIENLANKSGLDYNAIKTALLHDERLGGTHFDVPGPDGKYGYGGYCFPKDTSALLNYAKQYGSELSVLQQASTKNTIIRDVS
jgi:nucleotide sugar dehydrogenase